MKILIVAPALPNRFHRIRLQHILDALTAKHQITGLYLNIGAKPPASKARRETIVNKSLALSLFDCAIRLPFPNPLEVSYCHSPQLKKKVAALADKHDVILVKRLRAIQFVPEDVETPVVLDSTDAMSLSYKKAKDSVSWWKKSFYWEEWIKYRLYEKNMAKRFSNWVVSSKVDAAYLKKLLPNKTRVWVVPNVVDTKYYMSRSHLPNNPVILFSGLMEKQVNQLAIRYFLEEIFPIIQKKIANVKLNIVGPHPPKWLRSYNGNSVKIAGEVTDIRAWIQKASCVIAPVVVGTGTRNKILQALSHERPVVSTALGAEGLTARHRKHLMIADNPSDFAKAVIEILTNKRLAKKLARYGRELVERYYSLDTMRREYEKVFREVMS